MSVNKISNKETFEISYTLTKVEGFNQVYNWLNGEYIKFEDKNHPFAKIIKNEKKYFEKFQYQNSYDDFSWLLENKFITKKQEDIYDEIYKKKNELNSSKYLQLILLPAQMGCNFNCGYCYEDKSQKNKMTEKTEEILLKLIKTNKELEDLHIEWFGGEPLLNKEFIFNFSKKIQSFTEENNIHFKGSMTTNGYYLTTEIFLKLLNFNIRLYQITIDGLQEDHDKLRPLANGNPTFNTIMNNLLSISLLKNEDFNIIIRVNFNENSNVKKFIAYMKKLSLSKDKRFSFIFRNIQTDWNEQENNLFCSKNSYQLKNDYEKIALKNHLQKGDLFLYNDISSHSCYASKENSLVIYPDLTVRKCTVALDNPKNMVGKINQFGSLIKNNNWNLWITKSIHNKFECFNCSFNPQCLSSCCPLKFIENSEISCPEEKYTLDKLANDIISYIEKSEKGV